MMAFPPPESQLTPVQEGGDPLLSSWAGSPQPPDLPMAVLLSLHPAPPSPDLAGLLNCFVIYQLGTIKEPSPQDRPGSAHEPRGMLAGSKCLVNRHLLLFIEVPPPL